MSKPTGEVIVLDDAKRLTMGRVPQLDLFDEFGLPTGPHPYTNSFALFDLAPKHVLTVGDTDWRARDEGVLNIKIRAFKHEGTDYEMVITPARLVDENGQQIEAYPGRSEQIVEEALRRLAIKKRRTSMINNEPGVKFSFYELRAELKAVNSTMSLSEIKRSIEICHKCSIGIKRVGDREADVSAPIFPSRALAKRTEDDETISYVTFHPLVSAAILRAEYRLLNYETNIKFRSFVAKWLHKRMSHCYSQAALMDNGYNINASTVIRDSGTTVYKQWRDNIRRVKDAVNELKEKGVINTFTFTEKKDGSGRIVDVLFVLVPSHDFVNEMKRANFYQNQVLQEANKRGISVASRRKATQGPKT